VAVDALETIVLLPDADGTVGSVTVSRGGKEVVLTEAWTAATVTGGADAISAHPVDRALVEKEFAAALAGMPVPPEHFVIYFEVAMTAPSEAMKGEIARIAEAIRARKAVDVSVIGHADNSGKEDANVAISRKRADAVAETLVSMGVSREIIDVASHGSRIPLIPGTGSIAEPRNRRVEVTVR
jgi:adhesin transport system outer membrane protein